MHKEIDGHRGFNQDIFYLSEQKVLQTFLRSSGLDVDVKTMDSKFVGVRAYLVNDASGKYAGSIEVSGTGTYLFLLDTEVVKEKEVT